jgi:two-component system, sensor histidine kinase and response regulator
MGDVPKVLLVDDVEANLVGLDATLSELPCERIHARSGNDALRMLLKHEYAVLLLDVQMPEMDGYEVARLARSNPETRDIPIIFLTATRETPEGVLRGYGSGAVDYLTKPIDPHILRAKVRIFLDIFDARERLSAQLELYRSTLKELETANEALWHFTRAASHDLRQPVHGMHGMLELLGRELKDRPRALRDVQLMTQTCDRMSALLDSLLAYAGLQKPAALEQIELTKLVNQVVSDLGPRIEAEAAMVDVEELPRVCGDPGRLYQLFANLIGNALKFRRPGVAACVSVRGQHKPGCMATIEVVDNGIGIPKEQADKVFVAFQRLHTLRDYEGSGLGLAICRQIVEQHGGQIWVDAEPGQGARFCFTLNAASASGQCRESSTSIAH